jgi:hypothetical protein
MVSDKSADMNPSIPRKEKLAISIDSIAKIEIAFSTR